MICTYKNVLYSSAVTSFFVFFACITTAHAQIYTGNTQVHVIPQNPGPNTEVTIRVESYPTKVDTLEITWTVDGKVVQKGIGLKEYRFTTGNLGEATTITVSSSKFSETKIITPTEIDLIWQTRTYTPPFYKGKALYSNQSSVEFIALPSFTGSNGASVNPSTLLYTWTRNDEVLGNASGYGKNVLKTSGGALAKPLVVGVKVSTVDGSITATKTIEVKGSQPHIVFYENHPLFGTTYNHALQGTFTMGNKEVAISPAPYFFDVDRKNSTGISYAWKINNESVVMPENPESLVLRRPDGEVSGTSKVSLLVSAVDKILQFSNASLNVEFKTDEENTPL